MRNVSYIGAKAYDDFLNGDGTPAAKADLMLRAAGLYAALVRRGLANRRHKHPPRLCEALAYAFSTGLSVELESRGCNPLWERGLAHKTLALLDTLKLVGLIQQEEIGPVVSRRSIHASATLLQIMAAPFEEGVAA